MSQWRGAPWIVGLAVWLGGSSAFAADVVVVNLDDPDQGFNDSTPALPAPGNPGQTVGEQKWNVVSWAAQRLGDLLYSPLPINVEVEHDAALFCDANAATLAAAGPAWLVRLQARVADHPQLPTWYPVALAHRLLGYEISSEDVRARFNPRLGESDCLSGFQWYYGLDAEAPPGTLSYAATVLHELTHGMGFTSLATEDGWVSALDPEAISPYFAYAFDGASQAYWWELTPAERSVSATNGLLVWAGPRTTQAAASFVTAPLDVDGRIFMYTPANFSTGSSLSHFDPSTSPNLLMEPFASGDIDVFDNDIDLALEFLGDLGWRAPECGNGVPDAGEECDLGSQNDLNADDPDECTTQCTWFVVDDCPQDPNKTSAGACGCGIADTDSDGDGAPNCNDACPSDVSKVSPGVCGCGVSELDADQDGAPNCVDVCPQDPQKTAPGTCGCGVSEQDRDFDGTRDCQDGCPLDAAKTLAGQCGCGTSDMDTDGDATADCLDGCITDADKTQAGVCGCGVADLNQDGDSALDCQDQCPLDPEKTTVGVCGCGVSDLDRDADLAPDCIDECPLDSGKQEPGVCGCAVPDVDLDADGSFDCIDGCPSDPDKQAPGECGCGSADVDRDEDGVSDCNDGCPDDALKVQPEQCGCGTADEDSDSDDVLDCVDQCPDVAAAGTSDGCPTPPDPAHDPTEQDAGVAVDGPAPDDPNTPEAPTTSGPLLDAGASRPGPTAETPPEQDDLGPYADWLEDGGAYPPALAELLGDASIDPDNVDRELIRRLIREWSNQDGGLDVVIAPPTLPDACECSQARGAGSFGRGGLLALLGLALGAALRRRARSAL